MKTRILVRKGAGRDYDYAQDHCFVKLPSSATNGELSMVEDELEPGFRLPRHHHKQMTEVFYMLEGELDLVFDDETVTLSPGDTMTVPAGVWHAAESKTGGRMLTLFKNGRFDEYLERLSTMTDEQFQDADLMRSVSEAFDIYEA